MKESKYLIWASLIGIVLLFFDQLSKFWAQSSLPLVANSLYSYPYGGIGVFRDFLGIEFSLVHAINHGAAWGAFSDWQILILAFRIILIFGLLFYVFKWNTRSNWSFPLLLIIAGAVGNVLDYFLYGHVIDMLHFVLWGYDYPVFNFSDMGIFIGISWLMIDSYFDKNQLQTPFS